MARINELRSKETELERELKEVREQIATLEKAERDERIIIIKARDFLNYSSDTVDELCKLLDSLNPECRYHINSEHSLHAQINKELHI